MKISTFLVYFGFLYIVLPKIIKDDGNVKKMQLKPKCISTENFQNVFTRVIFKKSMKPKCSSTKNFESDAYALYNTPTIYDGTRITMTH